MPLQFVAEKTIPPDRGGVGVSCQILTRGKGGDALARVFATAVANWRTFKSILFCRVLN